MIKTESKKQYVSLSNVSIVWPNCVGFCYGSECKCWATFSPVSGPPHVIEKDLIEVGDKLFRLYAIDTPEKGHICEEKSWPYDFGWTATTGLMDLTAGVAQVMCYPKRSVRNGAVIAKF